MNAILPTKYSGTYQGMLAKAFTGSYTNDGMTPIFGNANATAEYSSLQRFIASHSTLPTDMEIQFAAFLKHEKQWWSGDFQVPLTPFVFNKWLGYGGAAALVYFMVLK